MVRERHIGIGTMYGNVVWFGKDSGHLIPQFERKGNRHFWRNDQFSVDKVRARTISDTENVRGWVFLIFKARGIILGYHGKFMARNFPYMENAWSIFHRGFF